MTYLEHNNSALKNIAELEQLYYGGNPFEFITMRCTYENLLERVYGVIRALEAISGREYPALEKAVQEIDGSISEDVTAHYTSSTRDIVLPFEQITPESSKTVGAKAANLAFARNELALPVPSGFAITAYAFERFMKENSLSETIEKELMAISAESPGDLERISDRLQGMILHADVPRMIAGDILAAYADLEKKTHEGVRVAMRSSAIGEDAEATFAGQYTSVLNVSKEMILDAYKEVIASKYSARAISYRLSYGLDDKETPMCVIGIAMIDSKASGVAYTSDPSERGIMKIDSVWGLGEYLVSGSASADTFFIDKKDLEIVHRGISRKEHMLIAVPGGGTKIENVKESDQERPSIDERDISALARSSLMLEEAFGVPQDVEWAIDGAGNLFILQSRPLSLPDTFKQSEIKEFPENPVLLSTGQPASPGIATGTVFVADEGIDAGSVPENTILVAKTSSPNYAKLMGRINGMITDIGGITSHLASVAREFGIPFITDTKKATAFLKDGEIITMSASHVLVYQGIVKDLVQDIRPPKRLLFESPAHRRMRRVLDKISPLNLVDPSHPSFAAEGCKTLHDIIRFTHEQSMKATFGLAEEADEKDSIRLVATIPFFLQMIDLGGGLKAGLTTCDTVTPEDIESVPMKAIWKGFTHPGITWEGAININTKNLLTLFASSAISEFGEMPGGMSYAVLSREYMNLSAKFGYHFATIDTLCSENSNQNYISLQFAGGAGNYYGKSLRVNFLGTILKRIGFNVSLNGDLLEASATGYDRQSVEDKLDHLGRLLASSRLLDMALASQSDAELLTESFFREEYNFLTRKRDDGLRNFYAHGGYWKRVAENDAFYCVQDASKDYPLGSGVAGIAGKFIGERLQGFLDKIEAYYYFPLAIVKNSETGDGTLSVKIKAVKGHIDRAGGIAFGLRNSSNYFVLRINALEDNVILFEYVNNKRRERAIANKEIESGRWYRLMVDIRAGHIRGYLEGDLVIEYRTEKPVKGFVGLWTKADSVTYFDELIIETDTEKRTIPF